MTILKDIFVWVEQATGLTPTIQAQIFSTLLVFIATWLINRLVNALLVRQIKKVRTLYHWKKASGYIIAIIGVFLAIRIWFDGVGDLATYFGLVSAGLAIALRDPIVNLAGWLFILWRRPFQVGDRIELGAHRGDVIDQRLFAFSLMEIGNRVGAEQSTGRVIFVPNSKIFTETLANYFVGFKYLWLEIPVLVTFESDWQTAKQLLTDIAEEHTLHLSKAAEAEVRAASKKMMIFYSKLTPVVYTTVKDSGVLLTIRCLCQPRRMRGMEQTLWEAILLAFAKHDNIDFAYPSTRMYLNALEGKTDARTVHPFIHQPVGGDEAGTIS